MISWETKLSHSDLSRYCISCQYCQSIYACTYSQTLGKFGTDLVLLKRCFRTFILFSNHEHTHIECFADVDWTRSKLDRRSTIGYCVFVGGNLISWSKKQTTVFRFSAESEYRIMPQCTCEVLWIQHLLAEVGLNLILPAKLQCDNQVALHIFSNPIYHERTKHIEID